MANGDNNSVVGGLMGISDPDFLINIGAGLMAGAKYGSNAGEGILQGLQSYRQQKLAQQQVGMGRLQAQRLQAQLPLIQAASRMAPLVAQQGQGQASPAGGVAPTQGAMIPTAAPQGAPQAPQQAPQGLMSGGDPFSTMKLGALMDMGGVGGQGLTELGKAQLQYNPDMATQMEAAKSAVAVDQQQIQQALSQGNQPLAKALYNGKLQQDLGLLHLSSMGGIQTRVDPDTGEISTVNPTTGMTTKGSTAGLMPGMLQALQQKSAAEAQGQATGQLEEVTDKNGNKYFVNKSTLLGGGGGAPKPPAATPTPAPAGGPSLGPFAPKPGSAPPAAAGAGGAQAAIGPSTAAMLHGNAESAIQANKEYQSQAEAGQQMLVQTQQLRQAANDFSPGKFAETRMNALQYLNAAGLITSDQAKSLGSAQEGQKIAIQLQAAATKQLGSREAQQIFQIMGKSLPNLTLSQNGLDKVSGYMDGIARYNMARAQVAQQRSANNDANGVNNVRNEFIQNTNPAYFVLASSPPAIQREIVDSMGDQKGKFITNWKTAASKGWAPTPLQYWGTQ